MIDKQGKIFGVISIIDIFITVAVIFVAIVIYGKLKVTSTTTLKPITIKFFAEEAPGFVGTVIQLNDRLEDEGNNNYLGQITEVNLGEGYMYTSDKFGQVVKSPKEDYNSIEITAEINAQVFESGAIIGGKKYEVGHPLTVRAGKGKIYGKISAIEEK